MSATFFVVGEWVDKYPESVLALHEAGHEVMNHSDDHAHFTKLSQTEMQQNINACNDKIEAVTGVRPTLFRPPYGEYDDHVVLATRALGMEPIQWDVDVSHTTASRWPSMVFANVYDKKQQRQGVLSPCRCLGFVIGVLGE